MHNTVFDTGQKLVVLAEAEVVDRSPGRERDELEVDHAANARAPGEMTRVDGDAVGDVEHRVRDSGELATFVEPERRSRVRLPPECRAGCAERAGDDEDVARL